MKNSLANNAYVNDILHQPDALRDTLTVFEGQRFEEIHQLAQRLSANTLERVMLTGMGSSFHALHPLHLSLIENGILSEMMETSELIHFAPKLLSPGTLVVAVSQSGRSIEILQLLDILPKEIPLIGITNTPESPLAKKTQAVLLTQAGSEHTVSCKTYVTALAALAVLSDLLTGRQPHETTAALGEAVKAMGQYLSHWKAHVDSAIRQMEDVRHLILAGRGTSLATVATGGLIIKESAHFPAEGMSCAAFRHGPFEMVSPAMFVLVFVGLGPTRQLNLNLVADIRKAGGRADLIAMEAGDNLFHLPSVPEVCLPLVEILPVQMISIALAVLNGHTPGKFERGSKVTVTA
jgi:glucosamine--fructose-6-phosphate aminotransferase (isomerizing)